MQDRVAAVLLLGQLHQAGDHTQRHITHWQKNQHLQGMHTKQCEPLTAGKSTLTYNLGQLVLAVTYA